MESVNIKCISVTELNNIIKSTVNSLQNVIPMVLGEVSSAKMSGDNFYFTLKDDSSSMSMACFSLNRVGFVNSVTYHNGQQVRTKYIPKVGDKVIVQGKPDVYAKTGNLSFIVTNIFPHGDGDMHQKLAALKEKLEKLGYFSPEHKKIIPKFPFSVGVVTSRTGAVIKDICETIRAVNNVIEITVVDALVQGQYAVDSLCSALRAADNQHFDVIILARGGGSVEDLMPFNDEKLALEIFNLKTPIISAIGHASDMPICNFVADVYAETPTAAAKLIAFNVHELKLSLASDLEISYDRIKKTLTDIMTKTVLKVTQTAQLCNDKLGFQQSKIKEKLLNSYEWVLAYTQHSQSLLENLKTQLIENDPNTTLKRGYFRIERDKKPVASISELEIGQTISLYGHDGCVDSEVKKIILNSNQ
ncbi:MAG: exodeoxyribonuclease VII large subunit [Christensenellaceae bacterium]|jgi:exodeoxyribonuclease VII large subunit|nr:exodeoxyribonuclease VII large subunit [Christensenellaceae bacterium]